MRLIRDDRGAAMVEYSLLIILIAVVALVAVKLAGQELSDTYTVIADQVQQAGS